MRDHIFADKWQNMRPAMQAAGGFGMCGVNAMIMLIDHVHMLM